MFDMLQLMDTKTADKKLTLMHFLVDTTQEKFREILNFDSELRFIDKAALGNSDNVAKLGQRHDS